MATVITIEQISAALSIHLDANLTSGVTISYYGEGIDVESLTEWAEVWVINFKTAKSSTQIIFFHLSYF